MDLPLTLRSALDSAVERVKPLELSTAARQLSERYRRAELHLSHVRTERDVLAYAAFRLPATYAAVRSALDEIGETVPDWSPHSLLDAGAGLGSASWAAVDAWPSITRLELVETDERMISFGRTLMAADHDLAAEWTHSDLERWRPRRPSDLTIMSYALGEIPEGQRGDLLARLWGQTSGVLLLVEPGTPAGFDVVRTARAHLVELGAPVIAPCPHSLTCPMAPGDWCHFSQRLARSRVHRDAKRVSIGFEDEKYSYVALSRLSATPASARVLRHPQVRARHIRLELCTREGLQHRIVSKRDKQLFRDARHAAWGSSLATREKSGEQARDDAE